MGMAEENYLNMKKNLKEQKEYMGSFGGFVRAAEIVEDVSRRVITVQKQPELYDLMNEKIWIIYGLVAAIIMTAICISLVTVYCCYRSCLKKADKQKTN